MNSALKVIVLAALYVLAFFIAESIGYFHPIGWTYSAVFMAPLAAWPYFALCERFPIPGMAILCAVLLLMCNFIIGQGHEFFALGCVGFGCLAEILRKYVGNYRTEKGVILSYAVMSLIPFSMSCVLWLDYKTSTELMVSEMGDVYAGIRGVMLSKYLLMAMIVLTLIIAVGVMWVLTRYWRPREEYHIIRE